MRTASAALLLASFVGLQPALAVAQGRDRRDRYEDRWDQHEDRRDRREDRRDRREDRWDRREDRRDARNDYWDASQYYRRDDRRYGPRRLGRNDRIYRGSDNRYYCRRDDGTTGLIIGGVAGGVLGNIIAPGRRRRSARSSAPGRERSSAGPLMMATSSAGDVGNRAGSSKSPIGADSDQKVVPDKTIRGLAIGTKRGQVVHRTSRSPISKRSRKRPSFVRRVLTPPPRSTANAV